MQRIFEHFPEDIKCVICKTSEDKPCILVAIDGTEDGHNVEANPIHVDCALPTNMRKMEKSWLIYSRLPI